MILVAFVFTVSDGARTFAIECSVTSLARPNCPIASAPGPATTLVDVADLSADTCEPLVASSAACLSDGFVSAREASRRAWRR